MLNLMIVENNIKISKMLINDVLSDKLDIRLVQIASNTEETIKALNNKEIDILIIDLKMPNINNVLNDIILEQNERYNNSVILMHSDFETINNLMKNNIMIDYILYGESNEEIKYKIDKIIQSKDIEKKRRQIIDELTYIRYNIEFKGTKYLIDTILQIYLNKDLTIDNLQRDVYPIIARNYKKTVNNIKCNIRHATDCMYYECEGKKLQKYLGLDYDKQPTTKEVIFTILNKII